MSILVNKGRNLHTANFYKELQLAFNAPDFYLVKGKVIPFVADKLLAEGKMFKRKLETTNQASMLLYSTLASIRNFRNHVEQMSH